MELKPRCHDKIIRLIERSVDIPNPLTIDVGDEVSLDNISQNGVRFYPGCRIYGDKTVISSGTQLGYEAPVTIDNCQLGPGVEPGKLHCGDPGVASRHFPERGSVAPGGSRRILC